MSPRGLEYSLGPNKKGPVKGPLTLLKNELKIWLKTDITRTMTISASRSY